MTSILPIAKIVNSTIAFYLRKKGNKRFRCMERIAILQGGINDLQRLQRLGIQCFREAYEPVQAPEQFQKYIDQAFDESQLRTELQNPESEFYFLKIGEEYAGFLKINTGAAQTEQMPDDHLEVERIYLLKNFYGQGLGRKLMDKAIEIARGKGKQKIWLGVWEENPKAIDFYKHLGFEVFGEHSFFVGDLEEVDLMMRLDVKE